jgi:ubiquinone/menaquinone biosynthesis C-methylase UbiE
MKGDVIFFAKNFVATSILTFNIASQTILDYDAYSGSYDTINKGIVPELLGINNMRKGISAKGNILEVAVGTGLQLPYYNWNKITSYIGVDSSPDMLKIAQASLQPIVNEWEPDKFNFYVQDASNLPFERNKVKSFSYFLFRCM